MTWLELNVIGYYIDNIIFTILSTRYNTILLKDIIYVNSLIDFYSYVKLFKKIEILNEQVMCTAH